MTTEDGSRRRTPSYADFDGRGVPAVAIGRIPAVTAAELRAYVDKVAAYERGPGGAWTGQALLVGDDADMGGDFAATNNAIAGALEPGQALSRVYLPAAPGRARSQASRGAAVRGSAPGAGAGQLRRPRRAGPHRLRGPAADLGRGGARQRRRGCR